MSVMLVISCCTQKKNVKNNNKLIFLGCCVHVCAVFMMGLLYSHQPGLFKSTHRDVNYIDRAQPHGVNAAALAHVQT